MEKIRGWRFCASVFWVPERARNPSDDGLQLTRWNPTRRPLGQTLASRHTALSSLRVPASRLVPALRGLSLSRLRFACSLASPRFSGNLARAVSRLEPTAHYICPH